MNCDILNIKIQFFKSFDNCFRDQNQGLFKSKYNGLKKSNWSANHQVLVHVTTCLANALQPKEVMDRRPEDEDFRGRSSVFRIAEVFT